MILPGDETNPILHIEELPRFPWRRPAPVPGAVHVYLSRNDRIFWPAGGFTLGELWLVRPSRLYVVDVAPHATQFHHDVTSSTSGVTVSLLVTATWQVADPAFVVQSHLVDVSTVVAHRLGVEIDTAVDKVTWDDGVQLGHGLRTGGVADWVRADGIELSAIRVTALSLDEGPAAIAGPDG